MAARGDVTIVKDGGQGNAKIHPYLVTLVRWCISCVWGTATVFLHRLLAARLLPIAAKVPPKPPVKPRAAGKDHLHPEPLVECVVLHQPETPPSLDVIFVHGLYGSLGNTWRQGDWRSKYKLDPSKTVLRDHPNNTYNCAHVKDNKNVYIDNKNLFNDTVNDNRFDESNDNPFNDNENISLHDINERLNKKIIPNENSLITEQFYNNTLLNHTEIVDNYDTQAKFVEDLFRIEKKRCEDIVLNGSDVSNDRCVSNDKCVNDNDFKCNLVMNECECGSECEVGCGCVCDHCYSSCWPRDWIKEDFPGARVISINYTSDPYLWRPLWVKQCKRLRLHERATQMMEQLLSMGVGERPIIWVGHSKGGLFIKQMYCEAYEAYSEIRKNTNKADQTQLNTREKAEDNVTNMQYYSNGYTMEYENEMNRDSINNNTKTDIMNEYRLSNKTKKNVKYNNINTRVENNDRFNDHSFDDNDIENDNFSRDKRNEDVCNDNIATDIFNDNVMKGSGNNDTNINDEINDTLTSSNDNEDTRTLQNSMSTLWSNSAGFMFYSVPHRGSPLADIKTPITARSIELLEIAKDCPLVLELQDRWLVATGSSRPVVRSLVETCRTLMSVLWLRIVSVDSAGVGPLHGVSVDHREICKPSSRNCLLYKELKDVIEKALNKCSCQ